MLVKNGGKKLFWQSVLVFCAALIFVSCTNTSKTVSEKNNNGQTVSENNNGKIYIDEKYSEFSDVYELINEGNYTQAYAELEKYSDNEKAQEMKKHFRYVPVFVDGKSNYQAFFYDENNLLVKHVETFKESNNQKISLYSYDTNGNLIKEEVSNGNIIEYEYDENGNLIKEVKTDSDNDVNTYEYSYNENGDLLTKIRNSKHFDEYSYDTDGKLVEMVSGQWNTVTKAYEYIYDENGNMIVEILSSGENTSTKHFEYDINNNKIKESESISGYGFNYAVNYTYDADGNLTEIRKTNSLGDESVCENTYDENNNLIKRVLTGPKNSATNRFFSYDEKNNLVKMEYYDDRGETFECECRYEFVYIPFELSEYLEELLAPQESWLYIPL